MMLHEHAFAASSVTFGSAVRNLRALAVGTPSAQGSCVRIGKNLWTDKRGDLFVEYLVLIGLVALPLSVAVVKVGPSLLRLHRYAQLSLAGPFP